MTVSAIDGAEALVLLIALRGKAVDKPGGWAFVAADAGSSRGRNTMRLRPRNAGIEFSCKVTLLEDHQSP